MLATWHTAAFLAAIGLILWATARFRMHPAPAILASALVYGVGTGTGIGQVLDLIGHGMGSAFLSPGLVILAAAILAPALERSRGVDGLARAMLRARGTHRRSVLLVLTTGGLGSVAECQSAFLVLAPVVRRVARASGRSAERTLLAFALALFAGHTLLLPAVGPAVVAAIFAADVGLVLGVSILTAVLASITGLAFAGLVRGIAEPVATADPQADPSATDPAPPPSPGSLPWAVALPILLLFAGTLGRFPREPLGSGELHHALTALGGPIALLLAALTLALTLPGRRRPGPLPAPSGLVLSVRRCAPLMLTVAAAGGFARILQQPGLGDFLGDGLTGEGFVFPAMGVLLPFAIAAAIKTVQGSSLVAAITAAGIVEPLFPQLGIVDDPEKALAVVAVGAGAMVVSHANDTFFWVVGGAVGLSPAAGYRILTLATLATGTAAILTLLVLQWVTGSA